MSIATTRSRAPRFAARAVAPDLALRIASIWLVLGCLAVVSAPALRGSSAWFGWLPVLMPAAQCLILRWRQMLVASRATLARLRARRRGRTTRAMRRNRKALQRQPSIWAVAVLR